MSERKIKVIKRDLQKEARHPLYDAFCNAKSVTVELARQIIRESETPPVNVQKFLINLGEKTV